MNPAIETIVLGMGCFWGAEKRMSAIPGVIDVESGYANGEVDGSYDAVLRQERQLQRGLSTLRNHAEVVKVSFDPARVRLEQVLAAFWENHDPTQGDRQGNDVGSNYRSAIYVTDDVQFAIARHSLDRYQAALTRARRGRITTEIAPLTRYCRAEEYHQRYLANNPHGYCGAGGTGIPYPASENHRTGETFRLVVFGAADSDNFRRFDADILAGWHSDLPVSREAAPRSAQDLQLKQPITSTPTIVLFDGDGELSRFEGYQGDARAFWRWLGEHILSPEQRRIAFQQGTERPFTGAHLDEKRQGQFVDPISGTPLFGSDAKFESGCGWPSFSDARPGALTLHPDDSHGMHRTEVRSASSGIHLGHVFEDGPPPGGLRYCINGNVLKFVADKDGED